MSFTTRLIYARNIRGMRRIVREILALYGVEFPPQAVVGRGLTVEHRGFGLVVSGKAVLGNSVRLYHGVTIGEADISGTGSPLERIVIESDVAICAGAKILAHGPELRVHQGCVIGANSVLLRSTTGPEQIWAGVPAELVGVRRPTRSTVGRAP